jgi:hypothetical protein
MTFNLRLWDFDMDSEVLGPIRCGHFDLSRKFSEFEASIRDGTVDSTVLARNVFQTIAHKRTGDAEVDAKCKGDKFSDDEVAALPLGELDQFCDRLVKGRLRLRATAVGAEPPPAVPDFAPGREGLAPALRHSAEADRAAMERTLEAAKRSLGPAAVLEAQRAGLGGDAVMRAMEEFRRHEDLVRASLGIDDHTKLAMAEIRRSEDMIKAALGHDEHMKSILEQTSMSAAARAVADLHSTQSIAAAASGLDDIKKALGDVTTASATLKAMNEVLSLEDAARGYADAARSGLPDLARMSAPEVAPTFPAPPLEFYAPAPNPTQETNKIAREMLEHQKREAEKKEADRADARTDSGENKTIAKSSLLFTKASFWVGLIGGIAGIISLVWTICGPSAPKEDATASAKQSARIEQLPAEIRSMPEARKPSTPAEMVPAPSPAAQVAAKPSPRAAQHASSK